MAIDDGRTDTNLAETVAEAARDAGMGARVWEGGGNIRVYLTRGAGRKAQQVGYIDCSGNEPVSYLWRNEAGICSEIGRRIGMTVVR